MLSQWIVSNWWMQKVKIFDVSNSKILQPKRLDKSHGWCFSARFLLDLGPNRLDFNNVTLERAFFVITRPNFSLFLVLSGSNILLYLKLCLTSGDEASWDDTFYVNFLARKSKTWLNPTCIRQYLHYDNFQESSKVRNNSPFAWESDLMCYLGVSQIETLSPRNSC